MENLTAFQRDVLTEVAQNSLLKIRVGFDAMISEFGHMIVYYNAHGAYQSKTNQLFLRDDLDSITSEKLTAIMFHELSHATMRLLGRPIAYRMGTTVYNKEEVVAELSSQILLDFFNIGSAELTTESQKYIRHYACNLTSEDMEWAKQEAAKASTYIVMNWLPIVSQKKQSA